MSLDRGRFAEFFAAVRSGQQPFAWQCRLLEALLDDGRWPDRIVAPTGAGKTAVVDVHVFANALVAAGLGPRLPRRLVLVVPRRAVVDSHDEHARSVAAQLATAENGVLAEMRAALEGQRLDLTAAGVTTTTGFGIEPPPLVTARLRGGSPPPRSWRDSPEVCAVLTGTPDMIGSRLLLQGYGSSPRAWPREAGLFAFDTAVVVDEAHLSRQFLATARRVSELTAVPRGRLKGVPGLQVVETTATPQQGTGREVGVDAPDLIDPVLAQRLQAAKPVELLPVPTWPLGPKNKGLELLVAEVQRARTDFGPTVGCVLNRVGSATTLAGLLRSAGLTVELLVGPLRPADVAHLRRRRPGLLDATGNPEVDVLVATQTVEVGIDLDLSALVTELAPGAALAQRSGRVNRRGARAASRVVVAVPADAAVPEKGTEPYLPADLTEALGWITTRSHRPEGLAPWAVRQDPPPGQTLRRTLLQRVELADSWVWARTGDEPFARPDLELWLADDLEPDRDVGLISRTGVPADPVDATALLKLLPPRSHEVFPVRIAVLRDLLPGLLETHQPPLPPVLRCRGKDVTVLTPDGAGDVRVGDVYVVDATAPVLLEGVVSATGELMPAGDVLEHASSDDRTDHHGAVVLRWGASSLLGPLPEPLPPVLRDGPADPAGRWTREQRQEMAGLLAAATAPGGLSPEQLDDLLAMQNAAVELLQHGRVKDVALRVDVDTDGDPVRLVVVDLRRAGADEDVRQTWTPNDQAVPLDQHATAVGMSAAQLGARLGLASDLVEVLRGAGQHHDDGKTDPRFQIMLGRGETDPPLAKSASRSPSSDLAARSAAGLPAGWRHEQLSALSAWRNAVETTRVLVTRLAGTSHGHGRSCFPHGAVTLLGVPADMVPVQAAYLFDEGGWEQLVHDTDEQHGVWAMAYLEALLRAADGRVSEAGS